MNKTHLPYLDRSVQENVPELLPYLKKGVNVLDVGCGPGV